jgi:hypothetical protein
MVYVTISYSKPSFGFMARQTSCDIGQNKDKDGMRTLAQGYGIFQNKILLREEKEKPKTKRSRN